MPDQNLNAASAANEEAMSVHNAFMEAGAISIGGWDGDQTTAPTDEEITAWGDGVDHSNDGAAAKREDGYEVAHRGVGAVSAIVVPFDRLRDEDRLRPRSPKAPTFFEKPHPANPYNTRRFRDVVCWAASNFPDELAGAVHELNKGGFGRQGAGFLDIFEYNCVTLAAGWAYQKVGLRVVDGHALTARGRPTSQRGAKFPRGTGWPSEASVDPEKLTARYTGDGTYPPGKNGEVGFPYASRRQPRSICAATGAGVAVVDFDGEAGLRWASENRKILPKTATVLTGSGGRHLYYRVPVDAPITNSASEIAQGVDIRGEGGQAILPPSIHPSGNFYGWEPGLSIHEVGIADAPQELIDLMLAASKKGKPSTKRKARAVLQKNASVGQDPFADQNRPEGFDEWLEAIGDHEGGRGFDGPILSAALSYFYRIGGEPDEGDFLDLAQQLRTVINDAERDPGKGRAKYDTDDYLDNRIMQAWMLICESDVDDIVEDNEAALDEVRAILRQHLEQRDGETIIAADAAQVATDHLIETGMAEGDAQDLVAEAVVDVQRQLDQRVDDKDRDPKLDARREVSAAESGEAVPSILAPLYNEKLVTTSGFMVSPKDQPKLYKEYGFKPKDPGAETYMRAEIRRQIIESLRNRAAWVVLDGEARWAIPGGRGEPVRLWKEQTLAKLYVNRGVSYREGGGEKAKVQTIKPAEVYIHARERDTFFDTCFEPDSKKAEIAKHKGTYNLWSGFAVEPVEGDWSKLRDHIRDQICGGDVDHFHWFMTWIASIFARPGVKIPSSIAITGEQGTGKSKVFDWVRRAIGSAALKVSAGKHLVGTFNAHLDGKIFLTCEEAFWAGDKAHGGVLKDLITSDTLQIEGKFANMVERPNYVNVVFISNNKWVIPTDDDDARRFFVLDCLPTRKQDAAFFGAIDDQMENGGLEAMVHELMNWNPEAVGLTWDSLRNPPVTEALRQQAGMGLSGPAGTLVNFIEMGEIAGRTKDGEPFRYELLEDERVDVSRPHLYAALGGHDARGDVAGQVRDAVETFLGEDADGGENKRKIKYLAQDGTEGGDARETVSRYVTVPALHDLRDVLSRYGRGGGVSDLAEEGEASAAA